MSDLSKCRITFESPTGTVNIDTTKTYSIEAAGVQGWMLASILILLGATGSPMMTLKEEP